MALNSKLSSFLNKRTWIIPTLFAIICFLIVADIVIIELRQFKDVPTYFAFSIGGELCALFVAMMMTLSIVPAYKRQSGYIRIFVTLITIGCVQMFLDTAQMMIDGIAELAMLNKVVSIFVFSNGAMYSFFFWLYATLALRSEGKTIGVLNAIASSLLLGSVILAFVNFFYPIYFTIDAAGVYHRVYETWWMSQISIVFTAASVITAIILSKEPIKKKIVIAAFMGIPVFAISAGGFNYGVSLTYTSMMVSIVLIYAFIFSDKEKDLYSTNKELTLATDIQQHMLPSIFPAFPERKEFDVYATMNAAKEVGGDFYDFFLIDDNHIGLVIADVSDKGVPAALFMMASKIMVQNYAMLGQSPAQVLTSVNKQICLNNQDEMFVTVWLGIFDLKTGILKAANAGHEKPVIKQADGQFEILNDKHGFVVGWNKDAVYTEYQVKLKKGSKIFVYTDGVPEATSSEGQFGFEKMMDVLNQNQEKAPDEILKAMQEEINNFVGKKDQFDDITMLCFEYKGCGNE